MPTIVNQRSRYFIVTALVVLLATAFKGCPKCLVGQEIVIPSSDGTPPSVTMDFILPNGNTITVTPGSTTSTVPVPGGGEVTVIVNAKDSEGVKDAQIWAAKVTWTIDPNTGAATRSGPETLGAPTASNADSGSPGKKGCTQRLVSQTLVVRSTPRGRVSYEISARGFNFGGGDVRTPLVTLQAQ